MFEPLDGLPQRFGRGVAVAANHLRARLSEQCHPRRLAHAALRQTGGEGMPEVVESNPARRALTVRDARRLTRPLEALLDLDEVDARPRARKDRPLRPALNDLQQFGADARRHRDGARPLVLTLRDEQVAGQHLHVLPAEVEEDRRVAEVAVLDLKAQQLGDLPHPRVHGDDHGAAEVSESAREYRQQPVFLRVSQVTLPALPLGFQRDAAHGVRVHVALLEGQLEHLREQLQVAVDRGAFARRARALRVEPPSLLPQQFILQPPDHHRVDLSERSLAEELLEPFGAALVVPPRKFVLLRPRDESLIHEVGEAFRLRRTVVLAVVDFLADRVLGPLGLRLRPRARYGLVDVMAPEFELHAPVGPPPIRV
jgi:hypothetical protein